MIYFGLAQGSGDELAPVSTPTRRPAREGKPHKALVYFGLAHDPDASRYGSHNDASLDRDIDALNARVAELEARLAELEDRR